MYQYDLWHSGVQGQKWGERNFQNPDGTWTEEGKARRRAQYKSAEGSSSSSSITKVKKKSNNTSAVAKVKAKFKANKEKAASANKTEKSEPKEFDVRNYYDKKTNRTSVKSAMSDIQNMSTKQLTDLNDRIKAEETYYSYLTKEQERNSTFTKAKNFTNKMIDVIKTTNEVYTQVSKSPITIAMKKAYRQSVNEATVISKQNTKTEQPKQNTKTEQPKQNTKTEQPKQNTSFQSFDREEKKSTPSLVPTTIEYTNKKSEEKNKKK